MTAAPSDPPNGDDDRTRIGTPVPPRKPEEDGDRADSGASRPPVQQPPIQQPPYSRPAAPEEDTSGWTQFGAPLDTSGRGSAPASGTPAAPADPGPPPQGSGAAPFSTPPMSDPAAPAAPGPGEPGWVPGGADDPGDAGPPGPGEPGWVPGGAETSAPPTGAGGAGGAPGPGEPGWVPGGAADPEPRVPGPGEPGWVPGGAGTSAPEDLPAAAPGPGEPGWVPGGGGDSTVPPSGPIAEPEPGNAPGPGEPGWVPGAPAETTAAPSQPPRAEPDDATRAIPMPGAPGTTDTGDPDATRAAAAAVGAAAAAAGQDMTGQDTTGQDGSAPPPIRRPRRTDGPTLAIGTVINNNYRIDEVLKAGGMGEVYRGAEVGTGDPVAIKVILPELAEDEKVGQMFKREARTLRQLQDEAIVRYYNYVHDPDLDAYCLVMAFISGVPLSDYTAHHGPISVNDGKVLIRRLAKGLEKAHELDVIHRDLSPDNVMLPEGTVSKAVLIDFGIAKSNVEKEQTLAGQFAGKFRYVSPEQLGHFGGEIGPQSDIYSLALLMAAALIGKPLDMGSSIVEAVQSRQAVPDLSKVPPDFRPILMHMLEPNPEHRPHTMGDIIRLLDLPEQIPLNYRQGLPLPNTQLTQSGTTGTTGLPYRPPTHQVSGLQLAPTTATTGGTASPTDLPVRRRGGGGGLGLALILSLAVVGGAGYYGYTEGWFTAATVTAEEPEAPDPGEAPQRLDDTREGFLAAFNSGGCTYATRIASGPEAGTIAAMASVSGAFDGLPAAFEEKFGSRPDVSERTVTEPQCAALTLARGLQGTNLEPIGIETRTAVSATGTTVTGTLTDPDNRAIWLVLVGTNGQVFNLTTRLSAPIGDERTFAFNLSPLPAGVSPVPQLVLAVATDEPLVRASVARDGTPAADLMPLIQREIDSRNGRAVSALAHVLQEPYTPPAPEPEPEPAPEPEPDGEPAPEDGGAPADGAD